MKGTQSPVEMVLLSSLEKVFPDERPVYRPECLRFTALQGETLSFQLALSTTGFFKQRLSVQVVSPIKEHLRLRRVECVPVRRAANPEVDDNYLRTGAGLYPDLLQDLQNDAVDVYPGQWRSLWVDAAIDDPALHGTFPVEIQLLKEGEVQASASTELTFYPVALPAQRIIHTEWFHADCLADYYGVPVFSEEHWRIMESFIRLLGKRSGNMILTPLFTPPLDIAYGGDRTTVQLVAVELDEKGGYHFDFSLLTRWVRMCQDCGMEYFEMSHLFSQWGAQHPPKVMARVKGQEEQIFGFHTPAVGEYTRFLQSFLPALIQQLKALGIADKTWFHLSDEPQESQLDTYRAAKESIGGLLDGFCTFDALSSYAFYRHGLVDKPIPGNNEIEEFLAHGLTDMWTYYCVGQYWQVSNRFMSMPSLRNRIYGLQLFKYDIAGVLHWGYNFYNSQYSLEHINPYQSTDAGGGFPAGDPFLVYPGPDGQPEESIRMMVHAQAFYDLRACRLLQSLTSKEYVLKLMEEELAQPLSFTVFPKSDSYLLCLRNRINREIAERMT